MAVYMCDHCGEWMDDDYHPMDSHPWAKQFARLANDVVCPDCYFQLEEEAHECAKEDAFDD